MITRPEKARTQLGQAAVQSFAANERMNQMLIEHLNPGAWRAKPPGRVSWKPKRYRDGWLLLAAPSCRIRSGR